MTPHCEVVTACALFHTELLTLLTVQGKLMQQQQMQQHIFGTPCGNKTLRKGPSSQLQCQSAFAMSIHMSLQLTHRARCTKLGKLGCFARASCVFKTRTSVNTLLHSLFRSSIGSTPQFSHKGLCTCSRTCKPKLGTSSKRAYVCQLKEKLFTY